MGTAGRSPRRTMAPSTEDDDGSSNGRRHCFAICTTAGFIVGRTWAAHDAPSRQRGSGPSMKERPKRSGNGFEETKAAPAKVGSALASFANFNAGRACPCRSATGPPPDVNEGTRSRRGISRANALRMDASAQGSGSAIRSC